jgi:hypothetical protein
MFQLLDCITNMKNEDEPVIRPSSYYTAEKLPSSVVIEVTFMPSMHDNYAPTYSAIVYISQVRVYYSGRLPCKEEAVAAAKAWLRVILEKGKVALEDE